MGHLRKNSRVKTSNSFKKNIKSKKIEIKTERANRSLSTGRRSLKTDPKVHSLKKPEKIYHFKANYPPIQYHTKVSS